MAEDESLNIYPRRQSSFYIIKEVYENGSSMEYFECQLEDALEREIQTIVIEPTKLGFETAKWISLGNFLHQMSVFSGMGYLAVEHAWPYIAKEYDLPVYAKLPLPIGAVSIVCSAVYTVSWQFDYCSRYQVEKNPQRLARLPLESCTAPVVLVRERYGWRLLRTLTTVGISGYCAWRFYKWFDSAT